MKLTKKFLPSGVPLQVCTKNSTHLQPMIDLHERTTWSPQDSSHHQEALSSFNLFLEQQQKLRKLSSVNYEEEISFRVKNHLHWRVSDRCQISGSWPKEIGDRHRLRLISGHCTMVFSVTIVAIISRAFPRTLETFWWVTGQTALVGVLCICLLRHLSDYFDSSWGDIRRKEYSASIPAELAPA